MKDFRKMQVWHNGHKLALDIYKLTAKFPKEEIYGLTSQIRRALPFPYRLILLRVVEEEALKS